MLGVGTSAVGPGPGATGLLREDTCKGEEVAEYYDLSS